MKINIKLRKLDSRGFSHDIGIVVFAVIFAIIGVGFLVASHADSCSPVSGAASSSSCPASGSVSSNPVVAGTCVISGVPVYPQYMQVIKPSVTITNTGNVAFQPKITEHLFVGNSDITKTHTLASIQPKGSVKQTLSQYVTQRRSGGISQGTYWVTSGQPSFSCSANFKLS